jgi:hypothetical protein
MGQNFAFFLFPKIVPCFEPQLSHIVLLRDKSDTSKSVEKKESFDKCNSNRVALAYWWNDEFELSV